MPILLYGLNINLFKASVEHHILKFRFFGLTEKHFYLLVTPRGCLKSNELVRNVVSKLLHYSIIWHVYTNTIFSAVFRAVPCLITPVSCPCSTAARHVTVSQELLSDVYAVARKLLHCWHSIIFFL
jgi:hypothetical protein